MVIFYIQSPFNLEKAEVEWVQVTTPTGSLVVGAGHQPMVSAVCQGESVVYHAGGAEKKVSLSAPGLLYVAANQVRLLIP